MNKIDFLSSPPIGTVVALDGQEYEMISSAPHQRKDGTPTTLLTWATQCPDCGRPFQVTTGLVTKGLNRRCADHRQALKPVSGRRDLVRAKVIAR
ncbi:MAG: hypothetical protein H2050_07060 [Sphingobium sp.]|uniref:hypothetical protein n=1 Tax=Sphingobium sp. TaxID=1912891 RepID=UPI0017EB4A6A|nr:hypothetical protein [Sphingobium sp.]MBA4754572.1 hypothetical protein [Sphingobium sp.]